jgi:hypothetical protein
MHVAVAVEQLDRRGPVAINRRHDPGLGHPELYLCRPFSL